MFIDALRFPRTLYFYSQYFSSVSSVVFRAFSHNFLLIENRPLNSKWGIWDVDPLCALYQKGLTPNKGLYSLINFPRTFTMPQTQCQALCVQLGTGRQLLYSVGRLHSSWGADCTQLNKCSKQHLGLVLWKVIIILNCISDKVEILRMKKGCISYSSLPMCKALTFRILPVYYYF